MEKNRQLNREFFELYEKISSLTNEINLWCGENILNGNYDLDKTLVFLRGVAEKSEELKDIAHQFDEHLAWDEKK